MPRPELSVVIPLHNEVDSLTPLVEELTAALEALGRPWEVLLVDDGSTDGGPRLLAELGAADPRLRVLRLPRRQGQSAALATGFERCRGEVVVTMDADLQNDPADLPRLLAALEGCDVVSGIRAERRDGWLRRVSSKIANGVRRAVLHDDVTDVGCTLKAYRAPLLRRVPAFDGMHRFLPALLKMEGARIRELSVNHRPRRFGRAKYGVHNRLWRGIVDLFGVRWLQARRVDLGSVEEQGGAAADADQAGPRGP